jgi:hypothetical protein
MTTEPFYEPRILEMPLEKCAEIAIAGGLWLVGELLAHGYSTEHGFVPDSRHAYKPRRQETAITELDRVDEDLRHRIFVAGFLALPDNGAQGTFRTLLVTHTAMLHEALRIEWKHRLGRMMDVGEPRAFTAIERLHKLILPR